MSGSCLSCGKPLGGRDGLCFSCEQSGERLEDFAPDEEVVDRLERFLLVSAVRCADCGGVHGEVDHDGGTVTAADFGIETEEDWHVEMDKEREWLRDNAADVRRALPLFEGQWPQTVAAIRSEIL